MGKENVYVMNNILSYIRWRGDITLAERPFNEVDNLIFAVLSYIDFSEFVPVIEETGYISLKDVYSLYHSKKPIEDELENHGLLIPPSTLLLGLAYSKRFGNAKLYNYRDICDENLQLQFAALHIELEDGTVYISFRGTDEMILAWREDFTMCYQTVPAQQEAARYLDQTMTANHGKYRIGGHSKGGNLAVYASMMCSDILKNQIIEIYDNDGPGLCKEMLLTQQYELIQDKIIRIIPQFCIIGMLFEHGSSKRIVKSSARGILQHDAMSWVVEGDHFAKAQDLTPESKAINQIFNTWIEDVNPEKRRSFITTFFDALEANGAKQIDDVANGGIDGFESILKAMTDPKENHMKVVGKLIKSTLQSFTMVNLVKLWKKKKMIRGSVIAILGLFFMQLPKYAAQIITIAVVFILFLLAVKRFTYHVASKAGRKIINRYSIIFYLFVISLTLLILLREKTLIFSTNISLGALLTVYGIFKLKKAVKGFDKNRKLWWLSWAYAIFIIILGIVALVASNRIMNKYVFVVGALFFIEGLSIIICEFLHCRDNNNTQK